MANSLTRRDTLDTQGQFVVKKNELIQKSRYALTLTEQKAVIFLISKITPYDEPYKEYTFNGLEFCRACGMDTNNGGNTALIRKMLESLNKKDLVIQIDNKRMLYTHWFTEAIHDDGNNNITVTFSKHLTPYLFQLKSFYTQYRIDYILPMSSKYAIRLYELLKSVQFEGYKFDIGLDELKQRLDCDKYELYKDFRVRVLEPAIEEINKYTDIIVGCGVAKKDRKKVVALQFSIRKAPIDQVMDRKENRDEALNRFTPI